MLLLLFWNMKGFGILPARVTSGLNGSIPLLLSQSLLGTTPAPPVTPTWNKCQMMDGCCLSSKSDLLPGWRRCNGSVLFALNMGFKPEGHGSEYSLKHLLCRREQCARFSVSLRNVAADFQLYLPNSFVALTPPSSATFEK